MLICGNEKGLTIRWTMLLCEWQWNLPPPNTFGGNRLVLMTPTGKEMWHGSES